MSKKSKTDGGWLVRTTESGRAQYLDGFRDDGSPVWKYDYRNIDPFSTPEDAIESSNRTEHGMICECYVDSHAQHHPIYKIK